jgi:hypothetical protein
MRPLRSLLVALAFSLTANGAGSGSNLVLKTQWAQKYRNRLSIEAKVTILHVSSKEADADIHGGSRANQVGLPMVAEILNGTDTPQAKGRQQLQPGSSAEKQIYGAWRLWFEHPPHGGGTQCQVFTPPVPSLCQQQALSGPDSNPDHSFEIHPVFAVNGVSVARSSMVLKPDNTSVKTSEKAFADYTGKTRTVTIVRQNNGLVLNSKTIGDNYVQMRIRTVTGSTRTQRDDGSTDGGWVKADVITDDDAKVLARGVRVFYFLDSEPGDSLNNAAPGNEIEILGMPRLNLDTILQASEGKQTVAIPLPIEFIAVAVVKSK